MKSSTQDNAERTMHQIKATIKKTAGKAVGNPGLEAEGKPGNSPGKVQEKLGQIKKVMDK